MFVDNSLIVNECRVFRHTRELIIIRLQLDTLLKHMHLVVGHDETLNSMSE